jgi:acylphosphatase
VTSAGYRIRGRVQGVGFRWWTRREARALGLSGTVRNCEDGSVEVRVSGSPEAIEALVQRLREGPSGAGVAAVESFNPGPVDGPGFAITG